MGLFGKKKSKEEEALQLTRREEDISNRIQQLENFIEEAPDAIRKRMEEELTMMPPPDDLEDRRREQKFYAQLLTRGEIRNERRYQVRSAFLLLLLATAIAGLSSWIYTFLQSMSLASKKCPHFSSSASSANSMSCS